MPRTTKSSKAPKSPASSLGTSPLKGAAAAANVSAELTLPPVAKKSTSHIGKRRDLALEKGSASYQERRNEIAGVAANLFNQKGFQGTSITAVAEAMEMDRATLYYYISNKQELFDEVVRDASEKNVTAAEAARSSDAAPLDKLRTLVVDLMNSYAANYPLLYVYIRENLTHVDEERTDWSKYMRSLNRRYEEAVIAIVQEGIDNGTIRPLASARVLAFGVIGMIGWTNRWFVPDRSPESCDTIGKAYAEVIVAGLATGPQKS
jgi:TetR/AcrR family transcriptional regulator, cholesterol catabolism regulator